MRFPITILERPRRYGLEPESCTSRGQGRTGEASRRPQAVRGSLEGDRAKLVASIKAARAAKAMKPLRSLVQDTRATVKRQRAEVRAAIQEAKGALAALRAATPR